MATDSDDLVIATDWLAATVRAFLASERVPYELPEIAYCDAMRAMQLAGWPVERTLGYCKRVATVQARSIPQFERIQERRDWLAAHMTQWLLDCYYDRTGHRGHDGA